MNQEQIAAIHAKKIGQCHSCEHPECPFPKIKKQWPHNGCPEWETEEANNAPELEVITVQPLAEWEKEQGISE